MKKQVVAIIGGGRIGKVHALSISRNMPNVTIKYVVDIDLDSVKLWQEECHVEQVTDDYLKALNDPEVNAILVCSSTDTHAKYVTEAANRGKDVFCEKPIGTNVAEIIKVLDTVKKAGIKLLVGFNRRFDHNFKKVKELINEGAIGETQIVKITSRDPGPPPIDYIKVSGGIFMDMTIHDFDMARFMTDSEVDEVFVMGGVFVDPAIGDAGDIDTAMISMKMKNGMICTIDNSRKAVYGYDQRIEVFGAKGAIETGNDVPSTVRISTEDSVSEEKPLFFFLERYMASYTSEILHFFDCLDKGTQPSVSGIDGLEPLYIAMACKKSYETGLPQKVDDFK